MFDMEKLNNYTLKDMGQILGLKKSQVANIRAGKRDLNALEVLLIKQNEDDLGLRFFNWLPDEKLFWDNIEALQSLLLIEDSEMAKMFSLEQRPFRFLRSNSKSLPWTSTEYFHLRYKIHPALWFSHELDCECLAKNIQSTFRSNAYLPTIFEGGGSKMRTLANSIQYTKKTWGEECSNALLAAMQITQNSLSFSEKSISIRAFATLHQKLRSFGAEDRHFIEMGYNNVANENNRKMFAQQIPSSCDSLPKIMVFFNNYLISKIDTNKTYQLIESSTKFIKFVAVPTHNFSNSFAPAPAFSQYEIALFAQGHFKVTPTYFGYKEFDRISLEFDDESGCATYTGYY